MDELNAEFAHIGTLLGIVTQLYTTRMTTLLQAEGFTLSQFALLNHMARSPEAIHSIGDLTEAMEINQPGVTKIVQKLHEAGWVEVATSRYDSRKREVSISREGRTRVLEVGQALLPDIKQWFAGWDPEAFEQFKVALDRFARWLDTHRLESKA